MIKLNYMWGYLAANRGFLLRSSANIHPVDHISMAVE
jgi:hypothetical protein